MIPEIAHFALIMALGFSCLVASLPLLQETACLRKSLAYLVSGQIFFVTTAFTLLIVSFISNDFSVVYVANNSSMMLPWWYKACAAWGAHEGSMLLWVFILSLLMMLFYLKSSTYEAKLLITVEVVLAIVSIGFIIFILMTSSPFLRNFQSVGAKGLGLNPLLQDVGFIVHPPVLYTGYVAFAVVFAIAISALLFNLPIATWGKLMRHWTLFAWSFLSLGITLGSWWAYRELGWGGFWFWDPVENASLMPWLSATALLHSLKLSMKQQVVRAWTLLLALLTFCLSLLGTFLVRSGVLISVHAFAVSPTRGLYMLIFLLVVTGGALLVYALCVKPAREHVALAFFSRPAQLLLNSILLVVMMLTVLLGTVYPLIIDAMGLGKLSVGSPYFNIMSVLIMTPILVLMAVLPELTWSVKAIKELLLRLRIKVVLAIFIGLLMPYWFVGELNLYASFGLSIACWVLLETLWSFIRKLFIAREGVGLSVVAMSLAHSGFAILVVGVICSQQFGIEKDSRLAPGSSVWIGPYQLLFKQLERVDGANYQAVNASFLVYRDKKLITTILAAKRYYPLSQVALSHAGIDVSLLRDLYIALGEPLSNHEWSLRLYYKPMVRFIWLGGLLMALGALLPFCKKQKFVRKWFLLGQN